MPIKREVTYPNARGNWKGCPMTCPESCPFGECNMPSDVAASLEPPHWHGWILDDRGNTVTDKKRSNRHEN